MAAYSLIAAFAWPDCEGTPWVIPAAFALVALFGFCMGLIARG